MTYNVITQEGMVAGSLYDSVVKYYYNEKRQSKALKCAKKILNVIQEVEDEDN